LHPLTTPEDTIVPLSSELFTKEGPGKDRLANCAASHQFNFFVGKPKLPGTEDAVERIQIALRTLGFPSSDAAGVYEKSTAKAVFDFKSAHRPKPILGPGQTVPDSIVGIQTIAALDRAMLGKPIPPGPAPGPTPPPQPVPKPTTQAWTFSLALRAEVQGIFRFRLELTDPASGESENFLTRTLNFTNSLGTSVTCIQIGTMIFSKEVSLDDILGCGVAVALKPTGVGAILTGNLAVFEAKKNINSSAAVSGTFQGQPSDPAGVLFVASELQVLNF
jgi:peptidoglycan hydrolase-like protein with peptidoglycan-binding domain